MKIIYASKILMGYPCFFSKLKIKFAKEEENICFWLGWGGVGWGGVPDEHYFIKIQIYDVISPHFHDFSKNMVMRVSWFWQKYEGRGLFCHFQIKLTIVYLLIFLIFTFSRQIYDSISPQFFIFFMNMVMRVVSFWHNFGEKIWG